MRKLTLLLSSVLLMVFVGCVNSEEPAFSISPAASDITFSLDAKESYKYSVHTNQGEWDVVSSEDWCVVTKDSSKNEFTVTVLVYESVGVSRKATITVSSKNVEPIVFKAIQKAEYSTRIMGTLTLKVDGENKTRFTYWVDGINTPFTSPDKEARYYYNTAKMKDGIFYNIGKYGEDHANYCYWVDGVRTHIELPDGATGVDFCSTDIVEDNGDVYLAGYSFFDKSIGIIPCYWKNGKCILLSVPDDANKDLYMPLIQIAASNGSVCVAGYYVAYMGDIFGSVACYWKDGVRTDIEVPSGLMRVLGWSIVVVNGAVHIGGEADGDNIDAKACYFIDGEPTQLEFPSGSGSSRIRSMVASEGAVYMVGDCYGKACYWVDGKYTELELPDGANSAYGSAIDIIDGLVFVAGGYYDNNKKQHQGYWADGEFVEFEYSTNWEVVSGSINSIDVVKN